MVNIGRPSTGCHMCRARRIKCDEGKPTCLRCRKSKRICPGYQAATEVKLRVEAESSKEKLSRGDKQYQTYTDHLHTNHAVTNSTVQQARTTLVGAGDTIPSICGTGFCQRQTDISSGIGVEQPTGSCCNYNFIPRNLSTPIGEHATCFFLANFVMIPAQANLRGYLDYLPPLLKTQSPKLPLALAFSAVALAALGSRPNSADLSALADQQYLKALQHIKLALSIPKLATDDSTLAAVILLSLFEQLAPSRTNITGWKSHVDGAVTIIKMRRDRQFQTQTGQKMFTLVRRLMTVQCIANAWPIDPEFDWGANKAKEEAHQQRFDELCLSVAQMRKDTNMISSLGHRTPNNMEMVLKLLREAETLEQQFTEWAKSLPTSWDVKTVALVDHQENDFEISAVYPGRVDWYTDFMIAYVHNIARASRLYIWTTILRCVAWMGGPQSDYMAMPEYTNASRTSRELIENIVASVPYFFSRAPEPSTDSDKPQFACGTKNTTSVKGLSGVFAMWPIYVAASSDFAMPSQRLYLKGRLRYISDTIRIRQACLLLKSEMRHPSMYIQRDRNGL